MTRPQIIRADTLDLQDTAAPTAQDHSRQPQHPAPLGIGPAAPHQEASLRQIDHERQSEESRLQNGTWDDPKNLRDRLNDESGAAQRDEEAVRLNGGAADDNDDADMQDAEAEDDLDDDDMMDKISSSPSIADGGYIISSSPPTTWPARVSSLSPSSTNSPVSSINSSSPFTTTPVHLPLTVAAARIPREARPGGTANISSSSSYRFAPVPFHLPPPPQRQSHHHRGEYTWISDADADADAHADADTDRPDDRTSKHSRAERESQSSTKGKQTMANRVVSEVREESQTSLVSALDEAEVKAMLQPLPRPAVDNYDDALDGTQPTTTALSNDDDNNNSDDDWTTDSDADSFDEEAEADDDNDLFLTTDPRFIDSGWGGECLRETEDIDFEFVYALHTFVATVEGQANATKGDHMILLDDSNSYWWLVRVVKDSSIGYLPAEHIETPTERLARLNKHRNIDLSATMLGDTAEKAKNPLRKAIRRRNAKTVQFGEPSYHEAPEPMYSSDEDEDDELFGGPDPDEARAQSSSDRDEIEQDDDLKVEPLKLGGNKGSGSKSASDDTKNTTEKRASDEMFDRPLDPKVTKNGTVRNTDSFFKDDNVETRKITLTPNLLRDDSTASTAPTRERGASLESLEKNGFADKLKEDKKKKEKKPGMLSGLFKRKDKKAKGALDSVDSDVDKSEEPGRLSPQPKNSSEERTSNEQSPSSPQRQPSKGKLQKPQRGREDSPPKVVKSILKVTEPDAGMIQNQQMGNKGASGQPTATMRLVSPELEDMVGTEQSLDERVQSPQSPVDARARSNSGASKLNPLNVLKSQPAKEDARPEKVKQAKQRVQLDDFDSEEDGEKDPFADSNLADLERKNTADSDVPGRLSESPVQISAADVKEASQDRDHDTDAQRPPGLTADTSSQETPSPVSTPSPDQSPSTVSKPTFSSSQNTPTGPTFPTAHKSSSSSSSSPGHPPPSRPAPIPTRTGSKDSSRELPRRDSELSKLSPTMSLESNSLPAWSDASLRMYLDDGSEIRDTLALIHDTTGVVPVGPEHPFMSKFCAEESKAVGRLGSELDKLLAGWLEGKRKRHLSERGR